jgi:hypothetical protein
MCRQWFLDHGREHGDPVFVTLTFSDNNVSGSEVKVFDPQSQPFRQSQSRPVQQISYQPGNAIECIEERSYFLPSEYRGQSLRVFGWDDVSEPSQFLHQHVTVQEEEGMERLVLCRSASVSVHGKGCEKLFDFYFTHLTRVLLVMKEDEAFDPVDVGLLGLVTIVPKAKHVTDLV